MLVQHQKHISVSADRVPLGGGDGAAGRGGVGGEGAVQQTIVTTAAVLQHQHVKCDDDDAGVQIFM